MKLKEALSEYYATSTNPIISFLQTIQLSRQLKIDMAEWSKADPAIDIFNQVCLKTIKTFYPDAVIEIAKQLCSDEWEELYPALQGLALINFDGLYGLIIPQLDLPEMTKITGPELKQILVDQCALENNMDWNFADAKYQVLPESHFDLFQEKKLAYRYTYIPESRDCDDFKRVDRGWLSMLGYGNLTVGGCEYNCYNKDGKILMAHAMELVVIEKESGAYETRLSEAQKNKWWLADGKPWRSVFGKGIDHIKIRKITF